MSGRSAPYVERGLSEPPPPEPPKPVSADEIVCRSCHLVVRRRDPDGVALLVCDDCHFG